MRHFRWNKFMTRLAAVGLIGLMCGCEDHGEQNLWNNAAWSPDQTQVAVVAGDEGKDLMLGNWPSGTWLKLAVAADKHRFFHPLWLSDQHGRPLISVFEIDADGKDKETEDNRLRFFRANDGAGLDDLAACASHEILAMEDLQSVQAGAGRSTLIYAGKTQGHWQVREIELGLPGARTLLAENNDSNQALVSGDGMWLAVLREPYSPNATIMVYPTQVSWMEPTAEWQPDDLLHKSYIENRCNWKLRSWSPDGAWLLAEARETEGRLLLLRPMDRRAIVLPLNGRVRETIWSETGRYLAYREERTVAKTRCDWIIIYDIYSNTSQSKSLDSDAVLVAWSPACGLLLRSESGNIGTLTCLDLAQKINLYTLTWSDNQELLVSPMGRILLYPERLAGFPGK